MPFLRALAIVLCVVLFYVAASGLRWVGPRRGAALADRFAVSFCRVMLRLLGVRLRVTGRCTPAPALIVANHVSWIDILAFGCLPRACFLAKVEVANWPVVSRLARMKGTIFVDRKRRRSILPANAAMAARLAEGRSVVMFPEGTTGDGRVVGHFGSSHVEAVLTARRTRPDIVVQPVTLAYDRPGAAWIGDATLLPHLWSVLRCGALDCTLAFAAPIAVRAETTRKPLARAAQAAVTANLARARGSFDAERPAAAGKAAPAGACGL